MLREARVGGVRGASSARASWCRLRARRRGVVGLERPVDRPRGGKGSSPIARPKRCPRTRLLYRQEILTVETSAPVFVVEGALKALHLWPHAVATLGKLTADQLRLLTSARRPVVFLADGDAWGRRSPTPPPCARTGSPRARSTPPKTDPNDYPDGLAVFLPLAFDALRTYGAVDVPRSSELTAGP